jgi:hypothetical protein
MMVKRGDSIGVSWQARIDSLASHDWQSELAAIRDVELQLPEYYQVPFHAYKDGNLSWQVRVGWAFAAHSIWRGASRSRRASSKQIGLCASSRSEVSSLIYALKGDETILCWPHNASSAPLVLTRAIRGVVRLRICRICQAAWEVDSAAQTVHSPIFDAEGKAMDPRGDARLRSSYNDVMAPQLKRPVKDVLDMGCATGLSTLALRRAFPDANITGVDLSPFFLVRCVACSVVGEMKGR